MGSKAVPGPLKSTPQLPGNETTIRRLGQPGVNASALSHAELDDAEELDEGDPETLARDNAALRDRLPSIRLLGGCCGTDHRHVARMATAWNGD